MDLGLSIKWFPTDHRYTATKWLDPTETDTYGVEPVKLDNVLYEKSVFVYNDHEHKTQIRFASMVNDQFYLHLLEGRLTGQVLDLPALSKCDKEERLIVVWMNGRGTAVGRMNTPPLFRFRPRRGPPGRGQHLKKLTNCVNRIEFSDSIQISTTELETMAKTRDNEIRELQFWHLNGGTLVDCKFMVYWNEEPPLKVIDEEKDWTFIQRSAERR